MLLVKKMYWEAIFPLEKIFRKDTLKTNMIFLSSFGWKIFYKKG